MYSNYLLFSDFIRRYKKTLFEQLTNNDNSVWKNQESFSLSLISSYLSTSYNIGKEFTSYTEWFPNTEYKEGDRVVYPNDNEGKLFVVARDLTSGDVVPDLDTDNYLPDNRNLTIVGIAVDLVIYDLQSASVNSVQEISVKRRDDATEFLTKVAKRYIQINLPRYEEGTPEENQNNIVVVEIDRTNAGYYPY